MLKKPSCVFLHASFFLPASFCVRLSLLLSRYDTANEYITLGQLPLRVVAPDRTQSTGQIELTV